MDSTTSPPARRDLNQALEDADQHGVGVLEGCLSAAEVSDVKARLWEDVGTKESAGLKIRGSGGDPNQSNVRVYELISVDPLFVRLASHPTALEAVAHVIDDKFLLSAFSANIALPGSGSMYLHADQGYVIPPWPPTPLAVNIVWVLDDYTDETGATRYVPDSHRAGHGPLPGHEYETVPIEAPAGSIVILDGRVWHTSGCNRTTSQHRAALFGYYVRDWLRPQTNWHVTLPPEVVVGLPNDFLDLLGYRSGNLRHLNSGTDVSMRSFAFRGYSGSEAAPRDKRAYH